MERGVFISSDIIRPDSFDRCEFLRLGLGAAAFGIGTWLAPGITPAYAGTTEGGGGGGDEHEGGGTGGTGWDLGWGYAWRWFDQLAPAANGNVREGPYVQ